MVTATTVRYTDASPEAVREAHARMYRRLRRQMALHREDINAVGWALLTKVAFALYVDSQEDTYSGLPG